MEASRIRSLRDQTVSFYSPSYVHDEKRFQDFYDWFLEYESVDPITDQLVIKKALNDAREMEDSDEWPIPNVLINPKDDVHTAYKAKMMQIIRKGIPEITGLSVVEIMNLSTYDFGIIMECSDMHIRVKGKEIEDIEAEMEEFLNGKK